MAVQYLRAIISNCLPKFILSVTTGDVIAKNPDIPALVGNGSILVFDFGIEVGGIATIDFISTGQGAIGIAFTKAKNWIGEWPDNSNGEFQGPDGALYANFTSGGKHTHVMPDIRLRGGFRYRSVFSMTNSTMRVNITDISLEIGFQPTWSNLQAYQDTFIRTTNCSTASGIHKLSELVLFLSKLITRDRF